MLSYNDAFYTLRNTLTPVYDEQEAAAIAHEVMKELTGLSKLQRLSYKDNLFTTGQQQIFNTVSAELQQGRPLQYVLGYAWFMDRKLMINKDVLIPRPETEELVQWIIDDNKEPTVAILDIGTGSGCIPISLKLALPHSSVSSCDVSNDALSIAQINAEYQDAEVNFIELDFLNEAARTRLEQYDIIVSNPPYIPDTEKESLHINVRNYEPGTALFVPGNDALLFYKAIAAFGQTHLKTNGAIYCELHVDYATDTQLVFEAQGYITELRKDMHGNNRMLKATKN